MSDEKEKITDYDKIKNILKTFNIQLSMDGDDYPIIFDSHTVNEFCEKLKDCDPNRCIAFYLEKYPLAFVFDVITDELIAIIDIGEDKHDN